MTLFNSAQNTLTIVLLFGSGSFPARPVDPASNNSFEIIIRYYAIPHIVK